MQVCSGRPSQEAGLCRHQRFSVVAQLRKQRPRFAQGQPKGYFQLKEHHRATKSIAQMNAD